MKRWAPRIEEEQVFVTQEDGACLLEKPRTISRH